MPNRLFLAGMCLFLSSCGIKSLSPEPGDPKWGLQVEWHGHSCFSLVDSRDRTVVIDPFDESVGVGRLDLRADALLISHNHFDHNNRRAVRARLKNIDIVNSTGTFTVAEGLQVTALSSFHDNEQGDIHGDNRIFLFVMGGVRLVHLGDVGTTEFSEFQMRMIGKVDVLFIPVGGKTTIDAKQAKKIVEFLKPAIVFPMHFGNLRFFPFEPVEEFTKLFPSQDVVRAETSDIRVRETGLTDKPVVYILSSSLKNY